MSYFGQFIENESFNTLVPIERFYPDLAPNTVSNATSESSSEPLFQGTRILYWYHPDYVSNVDLVTDVNGEAYELFLYNAWGESLHHWTSNSSNGWSSPYRFNSKELDPETGMHYYGARYHHPKLSVWMSVDPLAHNTLESYQFLGNNPITMIDPRGDSTFVSANGDIVEAQRDANGNLTDDIVMLQNSSGGYDYIGDLGGNIDISNVMENRLAESVEEAKSITSLSEFKDAVSAGSDWDFKNNEETIFGLAWSEKRKTTFSFDDNTGMSAADVGNYHYGYVGKFVNGGEGYSDYILCKGAGYAESVKEWNEGNKLLALWRFNFLLAPLNMRSGDRKADYKWTTAGMKDAREKKKE